MAQFTVILPAGSVLLKNEETGQTLTLSAQDGPLVLGTVQMTMTLQPAPAVEQTAPVAPAETAPAAPVAAAAPSVLPDVGFAPVPPATVAQVVPDAAPIKPAPSVNPNEVMPGAEPMRDDWVPAQAPAGREFVRCLDAPLVALTREDFDKTLEAMALRRNNLESEIEFLEEIEGDENDIRELTFAIDDLDDLFAAVILRKAEFEDSLNPKD